MAGIRKYFLFMILFVAAIPSLAQVEDCELALVRAQDEFNAGHFYAIPAVLNSCLPQFSREQSQRAYLLLSQTYLLLDDPVGAQQSYLSLLRANPEFVPDTALHPIDVIYLSKKFTATSIFSWFGKAGANVTIPRIIHDLTPFGETTANERYLTKVGYQAGLGGEMSVAEKVSLRGELLYTMATFSHETTDYFNLDTKILQEKQNWISFPLMALYSDQYGKYRPYGYAGYAFHYLAGNRSEITLSNNKPLLTSETGEREESSQTSPTLSTEFKRNRFNQSVIVGGGLKLKIGLDFVFVDMRYNFGMRNVVSGKNLYGNQEMAGISPDFVSSSEASMRFAQVDDFFRVDNLSLSIGFLHPLYKPRALKKARTRSVMRKMN